MKTKNADKITAQSLEEMFGDDAYRAIDFIKSNYKEWPKEKPTKPVLARDHSSADAIKYATDLAEYEQKRQEYEIQLQAVKDFNENLNCILVDYMKEASGLNNYVPADKRDKVWSKAWSDGHSSGYYDVWGCLRSLVEIFE